jgi:pyruvate/2-oxoglutarate dehydrogenase complex dihydrolipoamide dehydrogenase (E3) component
LVEGVNNIPYITAASIFNLTELPKDLLVVCGEPLGLELCQGFARLGCEVTIITSEKLVDDETANEMLTRQLEADGVTVM